MSRLSRAGLLILAAASFFAILLFCETPSRAGDKGPLAVNIPTVDSVKLKGYFYEGSKKNGTVILLHPIGEGKSSKDWKGFAESLEKAGYAVMLFDFRGHGDSTEIIDTKQFTSYPANRAIKLKAKEKDTIDVTDFIGVQAYPQILVNDIAAVKAFLDRKHDLGACNTANTIVIGADSGGTLGAIWINSEWNRYRYNEVPMKGKVADKRPEGQDIIAAVFLTLTPELTAKKKVSVPAILYGPCKTNGMAATFFYGKEDTKAKAYKTTLEEALKPKDKDSKKHKFIGGAEVPTSLSGVKLLQKSLGTDKAIVDWLDEVVTERRNEYVERDYNNATYIWRNPGAGMGLPLFYAKSNKSDKQLSFDTYERYLKSTP